MNILGLDFESYYTQYYSLRSQVSGLNTSEYVRDKRFKAHGASLQWEDDPKPEWVTHAALPERLAQIDWANTALLCWNTKFDGLVLQEHYAHVPRFYLDGMIMARILLPRCYGVSLDEVCQLYGIPGKLKGMLENTKGIRDLSPEQDYNLGIYANQDTQAMWNVFRLMFEHVSNDQLRLIHLTTAMFTVPTIHVNKRKVRQEYNQHVEARAKLFKGVGISLGIPQKEVLSILQSSPQFAAALEQFGQEVPLKESPTIKGKMIPAFAKSDLAFQALRDNPDERIANLVQARLQAKGSLGMTRATRILNSADPALPVGLYYGNPRTLRWSGTNLMNLQNLERGSLLRDALEAPAGYVINVVDSSQIEDRMNCWLSGHTEVLEEYRRKGGDPYKQMAAKIYTVPFEDITKEQRFVGKVSRLQLGYQSGKDKLHYTLISGQLGPPIDIERSDSDHVHNVYRATNQPIVKFWYKLQKFINDWQSGMSNAIVHPISGDMIAEFTFDNLETNAIPIIILPDGNRVFYADLLQTYDDESDRWGDTTYKSSKAGRAKLYGGKICENINQCLAKIVVADQILKISERYRVISTTHDEVWYLSHKSEGLAPLKFGLEAFSTSKDWYYDLPLAAEGGQHRSYGKAKEQSITLDQLQKP